MSDINTNTVLTSTGTITSGTWNGSTITVPYGGTGLTSLTAGSIPYGNGTSAFSSSSSLFFDGSNLGVGISSSLLGKLHVKQGTSGVSSTSNQGNALILEDSTHTGISILTPNTQAGNIVFQDPEGYAGQIQYDHSVNSMYFYTAGGLRTTIDSSGNVGIGVSPTSKLHIESTAATNSLYVKGSGAVGTSVVNIELDDTNGLKPALKIRNLTNFAHAAPFVTVTSSNGSDSGALISLINAGTGNYLTCDSVFSVAKSGLTTTNGISNSGLVITPTTSQTVANADTIQLSTTVSNNILRPTSDTIIAGAVLNFPGSPVDGQVCTMISTATITTVTGTVNTASLPTVSTFPAGIYVHAIWNASASKWIVGR